MSLRLRLTLLTVVAFGIGLGALALLVPRLVRDSLTDRLDQDLEQVRFEAGSTLIRNRPDGDRERYEGLRSSADEAYIELRDENGGLLVGQFVNNELGDRSPPVLPETLTDRRKPFTVDSEGGDPPEHWRVRTFTLEQVFGPINAQGTIVVALPTTDVEDTVRQLSRLGLVAGLATLGALALLAWWLIGVGLRPLRRMERTAAAITDAGDLAQRVDQPPARTELGKLAGTLNGMLSRLEVSFQQQQDTEQRLRRFVADASHELRTPLTSIRGYAELYRRGGNQPEQVARSMGRIEEEADRMGSLVEDLLILARADEGAPRRQEPVELAPMVQNLVDDVRVVAPDRPFTTTLAPCTVLGDRHQLTQAVANILTNARLHTPTGTAIDVTLAVDGGQAVLAVADHGPGLGADQYERVFDRFYRADPSRSRQQGGAGLGLAITAALVEAHDGTISAHPTPGGGATFEIRLPLAPATPPAPPAATPPPALDIPIGEG